jgi:hypothetical protein
MLVSCLIHVICCARFEHSCMHVTERSNFVDFGCLVSWLHFSKDFLPIWFKCLQPAGRTLANVLCP